MVRLVLDMSFYYIDRKGVMELCGLDDTKSFRETYLQQSMKAGIIEMLYPGSLKAPNQKCRLTDKGRMILDVIDKS